MEQETSVMDVLALPELVLVEVLRLLDAASLLNCRLVCRRLLSLTRVPRVWSHRRVQLEDDGRERRGRGCVPLHLAPCVRELLVRGRVRDAQLVTQCPVEKLVLDNLDLVSASTLLRNQVRLGRLKELYYRTNGHSKKDEADFAALLGTIAAASGTLSYLCFEAFEDEDYPADADRSMDELRSACNVVVAPSLVGMRYESEAVIDPFLEKLLAAHASTLRDVWLSSPDMTTWQRFSFPLLEKLTCWTRAGVASLLQFPALKTLRLRVDGQGPLQEVVNVLRKATSITDLTISYQEEIDVGEEWLNLVQVVAQSGWSSLSRLTIDQSHHEVYELFERWRQWRMVIHSHWFISPRLWERVAAALPTLPALRELRLGLGDTKEQHWQPLMAAIRPHTTPRIERLHILHLFNECLVCWPHQESVKEMLVANASLQLYIYDDVFDKDTYSKKNPCTRCSHRF
ncbi:uncharacterized protein LOC113205155 [Frankliniella occidentalis]|uniref:Uncharacterized protein LOC113205155 n=1 Tax=Frankliniella occidentalis TaxID=133901 RepID=A0A6J1S601_FRAOC|nr:uncharacterized protein LOC113205155 [Frankliniella occidentalis]